MAFPDGWQRKCAIAIQAAQVAETLTDFPLLITGDNLPAEIWANADDGGGDLRFSADDAGAVRLACEIVNFNTSGESAEIYVKVPSLSSAVNTSIWIWYNYTGQTQPTATDTYGSQAVWGSDYAAVYHFNQNPAGGTLLDSTANGNNGTAQGTMDGDDLVSGLIGSGWSFVPAKKGSVVFDALLGFATNYTVNIRFYTRSSYNFMGMLHQYNDFGGLRFINTSGTGFTWYQSSGFSFYGGAGLNNWVDITITRDAGIVTPYINSVAKTKNPDINVSPLPLSGIGWDYIANGRLYNGIVDNYRHINKALSAGEVVTNYNNIYNPATFAIAGTPTATQLFNPAWARRANQIIRAI